MHKSFQKLKDFMKLCVYGYRLKADTYAVAVYTPVKDAEPLTEEWLDNYLRQEMDMQTRNVRSKGYVSIFVTNTSSNCVMHVRCTYELGEWICHYLD